MAFFCVDAMQHTLHPINLKCFLVSPHISIDLNQFCSIVPGIKSACLLGIFLKICPMKYLLDGACSIAPTRKKLLGPPHSFNSLKVLMTDVCVIGCIYLFNVQKIALINQIFIEIYSHSFSTANHILIHLRSSSSFSRQ